MNSLENFSEPSAEKLSCLIGNLFAELEPPCGTDMDPAPGVILCGRTTAGREAMLTIGKDRCTFIGDPEDLKAARLGKCPESHRCAYG